MTGIEEAPPAGVPSVEEIARAVLARLWERFKESFSDQVGVLEKTAAAVSSGELDPDLRASARREAHKLAGSLGTYGMPRGSEIAQQLESWFRSEEPPDPDEIRRLSTMVVALRSCLNAGPPLGVKAAAEASEPPGPFLLLADDDPVLAAGLRSEAARRKLDLVVVDGIEAARKELAFHRPEALILNLPASGAEGVFQLMTEMMAGDPPVPVVVTSWSGTVTDRVQAAKLGGRGFLQKPVKADDLDLVVREIFDLARGDGANILAVDDDPAVLAAVRAILEPGGHRVTTLNDPAGFWEVLSEASPDLVLLDVDMPGVTGLELCQAMRTDQRWSRVPVMFVTSRIDPASVQAIFEAGADDYLTKPIVGPELTVRIRNRLDRSRLLRQMAAEGR